MTPILPPPPPQCWDRTIMPSLCSAGVGTQSLVQARQVLCYGVKIDSECKQFHLEGGRRLLSLRKSQVPEKRNWQDSSDPLPSQRSSSRSWERGLHLRSCMQVLQGAADCSFPELLLWLGPAVGDAAASEWSMPLSLTPHTDSYREPQYNSLVTQTEFHWSHSFGLLWMIYQGE